MAMLLVLKARMPLVATALVTVLGKASSAMIALLVTKRLLLEPKAAIAASVDMVATTLLKDVACCAMTPAATIALYKSLVTGLTATATTA
jgi:hypothetical protein